VAAQIRIKGLVGDAHGPAAQFVERAVVLSQDLEMFELNRVRHVRASSKRQDAK
jgi:hypothetical protein